MGPGIWHILHKYVVKKSINEEMKEETNQHDGAKRYLWAEGLAGRRVGLFRGRGQASWPVGEGRGWGAVQR